jgi:hypothetical protein
MIKKKIIVSVCLVSIGFLAAADKPTLPHWRLFKVVSPEEQFTAIMQKAFDDLAGSQVEIYRALGRLEVRVDDIERHMGVLDLFQPEDQLPRIKYISDLTKIVAECEQNNKWYEKNKKEAARFEVGDIAQFLNLPEKDIFLSLSLRHKEAGKDMADRLCLIAQDRVELIKKADGTEQEKLYRIGLVEKYLSKLEALSKTLEDRH